MEETAQLLDAIEGLYTAYAGYSLRDNTEACSCCHAPEDEKRIHKNPLRRLISSDLELYATDALLVWGTVDDFRHFLPRIFELTAMYGRDFVDQPIVFKKLYHAEWRYWSQTEQLVIEEYFRALWDCALNQASWENFDEIEDWLCGIAQAVSTLEPYLASWLELSTENACLNLARFIEQTSFINPNQKPGAFWGDRAELHLQVVSWVRGVAVKEKMSAISLEYRQYDFVQRAFTSLP